MAEKKQPAKKAAPAKAEKKATPKAEAKKSSPAKVKPEAEEKEAVQAAAPASNGPVKVSGFTLKQRQRLLDLRDELVDAMSGMTGEIRNAPEGSEASGSGMHQGDAGSDAYDRDFALSVLAKEQDALYEIEQALRRIDRGAYGICEMSGKAIPQARLEAIPFARLTVECQAQWEKEYGNRRFRPSNEVGFAGGHYQDDEDSEAVSLDEDDD
jgi:DnaK suppressor protein